MHSWQESWQPRADVKLKAKLKKTQLISKVNQETGETRRHKALE